MKSDLTTQIVLLIAGAIAGIFSGSVGAAYKAYLDRKSELQKSEAAVRLQYLYPLLVVAIDLKHKLSHAYDKVQREQEIKTPEPQMTDRYYLRHWFWKCKDYVENTNAGWSEEARRRELAMLSGSTAYEAMSTLYVTANYLWHATRIRLRIPSELSGRGIELLTCLSRVRTTLGTLEFYGVMQDSTGASMRGKTGDVISYREFCEAITSDANRAGFITLTDAYFKLCHMDRENVENVLESLRGLVDLVCEMLKLDPKEVPE